MKGPYKWWILRCVIAVISLLVPALVMGANLIFPGIIRGSIWGANIGMILIILIIAGALSMLPSLRGIFMRMTYPGDKIINSVAHTQGWLDKGAVLYCVWLNTANFRDGHGLVKHRAAMIKVEQILKPSSKSKKPEDVFWRIKSVEGEDIPLRPALVVTILNPAV